MKNPYLHIIAHPTGRLLGEREPYEVDIDQIMKTARETGTALEVNAYTERLDLDDLNCIKARHEEVMMAIGTDAHHLDQLWMMELGVLVARRGWLEPDNILNTLSAEELLRWAKSKRGRKLLNGT